MADEMTVRHVYPPPDEAVRVKLIKNTRGYGWEIGVAGKDGKEALEKLREVEERLKAAYNGEEE